jgi:AGCS family alanine or glycine:cation symporter
MKTNLLCYLTSFLLITISSQGQENTSGITNKLKVKAVTGNYSSTINDGYIKLNVLEGTPPYTYKWSNRETALSSDSASGLVEGIPYKVIISDAENQIISKYYTVEAKSITEKFNSNFTPLVRVMSNILFWDPFASLGLYDPIMYAEEKLVPAPSWNAKTNKTYTLQKKLVEDGTEVKEGQEIALVTINEQQVDTVKALASGTVNFLYKEGQFIFNPESGKDLIEQGAHYLAKIKYDNPVPLKYPNGDIKEKQIPFIVVWLILGATFFTFRMGFINLRGFKHSIQLVRGQFSDPNAPGQVTHFQALATAVSATVGLGNIAGVAVAVSLGGAGILAGFLGMSTKFVECTLGVKYRQINKDGKIFGGPMNYLRFGLEKRKMKKLGQFLAGLFSILCVGASFGAGNMFQSNQSYKIMASQFSFLEGYGFGFGVGMSLLVGIVIIGGIQSIAKVTEKIVPMMAAVYVIAALVVIGINIENIGPAFSAIYNGAFSPNALKGGFIGVLIVGFQRAAFSNEAGAGSAAIAHSATKTHNPPSEGFVALMEPFIDTVVVCTLTALVLIFTGMHEVSGVGGVELTSEAFGTVISWFPMVLSIAVFLFAFSSMISWSYYGMRGWTYLFGKSKKSEISYKIIFLVFVVVGSSVSLGAVLDFSDMMILAMSVPNMIGLYILSGEVRADLKEYINKLKTGQLYFSSKEK